MGNSQTDSETPCLKMAPEKQCAALSEERTAHTNRIGFQSQSRVYTFFFNSNAISSRSKMPSAE